MAKKVVKKRKTTVRKRAVAKKSVMPTSSAMNAYDLLGDIKKIILKEPLRYDQRTWLEKRDPKEPDAPRCGTVGCVAGWVIALKRPELAYNDGVIALNARMILGLDETDADELFSSYAADGAGGTAYHAESGAEHIERFRQEHSMQLRRKRV